MLKDILAAFSAPKPEPLKTDDARLALAALLVRVARTDGDYAAREQAMILHVLQGQYDLDETAASALKSEAELLEEQAPDTVRFTRTVKEAVPYEDRDKTLEALWAVVLSDGTRDHEEDAFMRLTANLLGLNDKTSALARQRVLARL